MYTSQVINIVENLCRAIIISYLITERKSARLTCYMLFMKIFTMIGRKLTTRNDKNWMGIIQKLLPEAHVNTCTRRVRYWSIMRKYELRGKNHKCDVVVESIYGPQQTCARCHVSWLPYSRSKLPP